VHLDFFLSRTSRTRPRRSIVANAELPSRQNNAVRAAVREPTLANETVNA